MKTYITKIKPALWLSFFVLASFCFWSCEEQKAAERPAQKVETVQLKKIAVPLIKEHVGQLFGVRDIPIRARVDGYLEGLHFQEGSLVKKGQLLYSIDPQPFKASEAAKNSQLSEAKVRAARAKKDLDRIEPLVKIKAISQSDYDAAKAEYDAAMASVSAARANLKISQLDVGYAEIHSPISGIIGRTEAKVGEYVGREPNPVILNSVSRTDTILVQFFLNEKEYLSVFRQLHQMDADTAIHSEDIGRKTEFELILADGSVFSHKGKFDFLDRQVNAATGSMLVQASFPNPTLFLRPGQFARVRTTVTSNKTALVIPQRAVTDFQGQKVVYTVTKDNKIVQKNIHTGFSYKDYYTVEDGLKEGEQVVFEGIQKVREGMTVNPTLIEFKSQVK